MVNFHHNQIVHQEQLVKSVITSASQIIIPEYIINVLDTPARIDPIMQGLLCKISLMSRSLHKSNRTSKPKHIYADTAPTPKQAPLTPLLTNSPVLFVRPASIMLENLPIILSGISQKSSQVSADYA